MPNEQQGWAPMDRAFGMSDEKSSIHQSRFPRLVNKTRHNSDRRSTISGTSYRLDETVACDSLGVQLQAFCRRTKRHFSEDSGFSSCSSSVSSLSSSSVGDDSSSAASSCGSNTVAAVLAAGAASDSEQEQDGCSDSSDEEVDDVFDCASESRESCGRARADRDHRDLDLAVFIAVGSHWSCTRQVKALYCGRDFLDLGSNLKTNFPMQPTHLPSMNLPMFMENRSQYHRLGKFGTKENFVMMKCINGCGFRFPVPTAHPDC